jgi:hypothetical protein
MPPVPAITIGSTTIDIGPLLQNGRLNALGDEVPYARPTTLNLVYVFVLVLLLSELGLHELAVTLRVPVPV